MIQTYNEVITQHPTQPVPRKLLRWITCGSVLSALFTITYLIEGATRPGYNAFQQAVSALSLGPGGWVQQVNFIVFGIIILSTTFAWREILKGGIGATWYPIFRILLGIGLIVDGIFSQDPAPGYPQGAILTAPTLHAEIHLIFACVSITAMAFGCFVLARRFSKEPDWHGWATYSVITGLLIITFITIFGIATAHHSAFAGLLERITTFFEMPWGFLIVVRLWTGAGFIRH